MTDEQTKEAINLLHEARRIVRSIDGPTPTTSTDDHFLFLANSESFLSDSLNVKPRYDPS